jgi:hypothetical protein
LDNHRRIVESELTVDTPPGVATLARSPTKPEKLTPALLSARAYRKYTTSNSVDAPNPDGRIAQSLQIVWLRIKVTQSGV